MKKVVLISCVKKKLLVRSKAQDLYISTLFQLNLKYARSLNPDVIYILSTKYGLLELDQEVETYNLTLNRMSETQKRDWAKNVLKTLQQKTNLSTDHFIFLAGNNYRKYLIPSLEYYEIPLDGLPFGRQLSELKKRVG